MKFSVAHLCRSSPLTQARTQAVKIIFEMRGDRSGLQSTMTCKFAHALHIFYFTSAGERK